MDFRVPQFIEHDPKILGPFTLSQTLYVGGAVGICFILNFYMRENLFLYVMACGLIGGAALALAFGKVEGQVITKVGKNFTAFSLKPRMYLWKKKEAPFFLASIKQKEFQAEQNQTKAPVPSPLKIRAHGKIESLIKKIDYEK